MGVLVRNNLSVETNILTQSMNMVVNSVMEVFLELTYLRLLDPTDLLSRRKGLEDGMYVWLHERTLKRAIFEVSLPGESDALEHFEIAFTYSDTPDSEVKRAHREELQRFCHTLNELPPGSSYDIIVCLTPGAKEVPGWVVGMEKPINPTVEKQIGTFGYGPIAGELRYRGGTF